MKTVELEKISATFQQIEKKWAEDTEKMISQFDHRGEPFFVFTFTKLDLSTTPHTYKIFHIPRKELFEHWMLPGTIMRKIDPKGSIETLWSLPQQEDFELYEKNKVFSNEFIYKCICKYKEKL